MKICFFLLLISICYKIHGQQIDFKVLENIQNCTECKGICLKYDTDGILAKQIFYSQHATVDSIYYFDLKGERILSFRPDYKIDSSCFDSIIGNIDKSILSCAVNGAELQQVMVFIKL